MNADLLTIMGGIGLFLSSLLTILARDVWARIGLALAGFSLIFMGTELMQDWMFA